MKRGRNNRPEMLGDKPVDPNKTADLLQSIAAGLDQIFNGPVKASERKIGFVLLSYPFDGLEGARCNYVSNGADRKDIVALMKEMIARFEGAPEAEGHA